MRRLTKALSYTFLTGLCLTASACKGGGGDDEPDTDHRYVNDACLVDADCGPGHSCTLGICAQGCEVDSDCGDGSFCDPHGSCIVSDGSSMENPFSSTGAVALEQTKVIFANDMTSVKITLHNDGPEELTYRLSTEHEAVTTVREPSVAPPFSSTDLEIEVDAGKIDPEMDHIIPIAVHTEVETLIFNIEVPPTPSGHYGGQIAFGSGDLLGANKVSLNLEFADGGTIGGQLIAEDSVMWPTPITVSGTWDSSTGEVFINLIDKIPASVDGGASLGTIDSPLQREIGREVTLHGFFDATGSTIEGELVEALSGVIDSEIEYAGTFRLGHQGGPKETSETPVDFSDQVPIGLPEWEWPAIIDDAQCTDLGTAYGTAGTIEPGLEVACSSCANGVGGTCTHQNALDCAEGLLAAGFNVPAVLADDPSNDSIQVPDPDASWTWDECMTEDASGLYIENKTCIDRAAVRCAGTLLRYATEELDDPDSIGMLLAQTHTEGTIASLVGTEAMIDAAFAFRSVAAGAVADEEVRLLRDEARPILDRSITVTNSPGYLHLVAAVGLEGLITERDGKDIALAMTNAGKSTEALTTQLRVQVLSDLDDDNRDEMRSVLNHTAAWSHVQALMWRDVLDFYGVGDDMGELNVFGESVITLAKVAEELDPDNNGFGFSNDYVPIKLTADDEAISNFEIVWEDANFEVTNFQEELDKAATASDQYETEVFKVQTQVSQMGEKFDSRLGELCGWDGGDPDLAGCGQTDASEIGILKLRMEDAELRVKQARTGLENNHQRILIEEERMREHLLNAEFLQGQLDDFDGDVFAIQNMAGEQRSAKRMSAAEKECQRITENAVVESIAVAAEAAANAANAAGSVPPNAAGAGGYAAAGAARVAAVIVQAENECEGVKDGAKLENELEDIDRWEEQQLMIIDGEIDKAVRESELADKQADSTAVVKNLLLDNLTLGIEVEKAVVEVKIANGELKQAIEEVSSLITRRQRALDLLTNKNPTNPLANPRFLQARMELGKDVLRRRGRVIREAYKAGRALEYHINQGVPGLDLQLASARSGDEVGDFMNCTMSIFNDYKEQPSTQPYESEISIRDDIFGLGTEVIDEVTGDVVSPAAQFNALLASPDHVLDDGSVELRISLPLVGDTLFSSFLCDDRVVTLEVQVVGRELGDDELLVLVDREGHSSMRRCDSGGLATSEALTEYNLGSRRAAVQAGVNAFESGLPNGSFTDWPVGGEQWVIRIPVDAGEAPQNADMNLAGIEDIILKVSHRARSLSDPGVGGFKPSCG